MMSKVNGGLEQVFLNYSNALRSIGCDVIDIIHPKAQIKSFCEPAHLIEVHNFNQHDLLAIFRLKYLIKKHRPDVIITHSHRAAYLIGKTKTLVPSIAVCHVKGNYHFGTTAVIALTESMREDILASGISKDRVFKVPNMISPSQPIANEGRHLKKPVVIGTCLRFTEQKGCDVFIRACHVLKMRGVSFHAYIAGDGPMKAYLKDLISSLGLETEVVLLGWVDNKSSFYQMIDIFCLPSREEAFGLVLLESMAHALPVVVSDLPGPREVIAESNAAQFVPVDDFTKMADAIETLMVDVFYQAISQNALERARCFSSKKMAPLLLQTLKQLMAHPSLAQ